MEGNHQLLKLVTTVLPSSPVQSISIDKLLEFFLIAVRCGIPDRGDEVERLPPSAISVCVSELDTLPRIDVELLEVPCDRDRSRILPVQYSPGFQDQGNSSSKPGGQYSHLIQQVIDALLVQVAAVALELCRQCDVQHADLRRCRTSVTGHLPRQLVEPDSSLRFPDPHGPKFPHAKHRTRIRCARSLTSPVH